VAPRADGSPVPSDLWSALEKVHERPKLAGPLRRFSYALERTLPEDKLVDLMIGAESLFFSDIGPADRGEFRFRLSTRVALLVGETPDERRQIPTFGHSTASACLPPSARQCWKAYCAMHSNWRSYGLPAESRFRLTGRTLMYGELSSG